MTKDNEPSKNPWGPMFTAFAIAAVLLVVAWFAVEPLFGKQIDNIEKVAQVAVTYCQAALDDDPQAMSALGRSSDNIDLARQSHAEVSSAFRSSLGENARATVLGVNSKQTDGRFEYHVAVSLKSAKKSRKAAVTVLVVDKQPRVFWAEIRE